MKLTFYMHIYLYTYTSQHATENQGEAIGYGMQYEVFPDLGVSLAKEIYKNTKFKLISITQGHKGSSIHFKKSDIKKKWVLIDAQDAVLGRLAVISANILRGKNKPEYTPNQDCGDNLIIINSDKIHLKGKKADNKIYYRHTGYPGGIKETTPNKMKEKNKSDEMIKLAIKRMIPRGPLGKQQLSNCKIYRDENHKHEAQNPQIVDIASMNTKNKI